ncbi:MAG: NAD(P)-dependent alcohol dehydrogenase [Ferruginibacter sp.]
MKAVYYDKYGPPEVLYIKEIEKPVPGEKEILVKIHATAVSSGDVRMRKADPFAVRLMLGLMQPSKKVLGLVFAGVIEAIGKDVSMFKTGDSVYGSTFLDFGAYADYKCLPETGIVALKPRSLTFEEAAAIPFGAVTALHFLKKAKIKRGQKVLVYGASGAVGTAAVQLAKYFGADVTAVCSTSNVEMVKSLGATKVIDYTKEDFSKAVEAYDIVFDTVGKTSFSGSLRSLKKNGYYPRVVHMSLYPVLAGLWVSLSTNKKVIGGVAIGKAEDLIFLNNLIDEGQLIPVVDRMYPLEQIVEAHRYVEQGHKKGNVVITV